MRRRQQEMRIQALVLGVVAALVLAPSGGYAQHTTGGSILASPPTGTIQNCFLSPNCSLWLNTRCEVDALATKDGTIASSIVDISDVSSRTLASQRTRTITITGTTLAPNPGVRIQFYEPLPGSCGEIANSSVLFEFGQTPASRSVTVPFKPNLWIAVTAWKLANVQWSMSA